MEDNSSRKETALRSDSGKITASTRTDEALRKIELQHQTILQSAMDGFWLVNLQGRIMEVNEAYCKMSGYTFEELITMSVPDLDVKESQVDYAVHIQKVHTHGKDRFVSCHRNKDGSIFDVEISLQFDPVAGFLFAFLRDITEQKRAETEILYKGALLDAQLNATLDGILIVNPEGKKIIQNQRTVDLWKIPGHIADNPDDSAQMKHIMHFTKNPQEFIEKVTYLYDHPNETSQDTLELTDGTILERYSAPVLGNNGQNFGRIWTFHDITARHRAEEELLKTQKLESLGILAGGIAHDFNNLMGGIFGYIDLASVTTKESKVGFYLSKAMNTIDRARALTRQLLTFAKGGAPIQEIGHLFPFVEETAKFALSGANVSCNFVIQQDLWACIFDKNQIGQVIDNLIINAQQAMPVGGTIELAARNITLAEKEHAILGAGNYVKLLIRDTGIGIPKEFLSRIFDPFFTTKPKGHGLGLATCYSIINRHGGCIDVDSEQGKGSSFHVYLPASMESVLSAQKKSVKTHKGSGTFLVMDDEEVMRDTIADMLEILGYAVVSKENGKEAVDFFASETKSNRKITGMIFDLTVPGGMGGKAAIEEIRKLNKDIPAFVASGYADDPVMKTPSNFGFTASISKPFRNVELTELLDKYLKPKK